MSSEQFMVTSHDFTNFGHRQCAAETFWCTFCWPPRGQRPFYDAFYELLSTGISQLLDAVYNGSKYHLGCIWLCFWNGGACVRGVKRKYIEATYDLLSRDGLEGVSIRKIADEIGCSSAALYRHFPDIDKLVAVASIRFLRDYIEDARILSKVDLNPMELNLQLWECLAYYSFRNADVFENLFFGDPTGVRYSEATNEYFEQYPEDIEGLRDFMLDIVRNSSIIDRETVLLSRAADMGMLSLKAAEYLCKLDAYLYRGALASLRGRDLDDDGFRAATKEFMQLLVRSYTTQLEEGCSILVVKPDFVAADELRDAHARASYRVKIETVKCAGPRPKRKRASA